MLRPIDHERIRDAEDRSCTFALVDLALGPSTAEADRDQAFRTLAWLEDYRSVAPLTAVVGDRRAPEPTRREASAVLRGFDGTTTSPQRRAWWATGDSVLAEHALGLMTRREADIVTSVAGDDRHPLQAFALGRMEFGYDEPELQSAKIRALGHPDPEVREAAAGVLVWDEPADAEEPLLDALADPSPAVVAAAVDTLQYYASRRVLRAVSALLDAPDEEVRSRATESFEFIQGSFEAMATEGDAAAVARLREWMEPVRDLVRGPDEIQELERSESATLPARRPVPEPKLRDLLGDPDGEWGAKKEVLRNVDWGAYGHAERERLVGLMVGHPDPVVRDVACSALAAWGRSGELLTLTCDTDSLVRKSAMYHLGLLPPDPSLAEPAWSYMGSEAGTTADEGLVTYAAHAPAEEAKARLVSLARDDRRESVVTHAIGLLTDLEARPELQRLLPMLDLAPGVTWAVHIALLDAARKLGLPCPPLHHLAAIDNLHLVQAVVAAECAGP